MSRNRVAVSLLATAALALAAPVLAGDKHDHGKSHDHGKEAAHSAVTPPADVKTAWGLIATKLAEAETALGAKNLDGAHSAAEHLEAAVHTLENKTDAVPADQRTKLASALKQFDKAIDELHHGTEEKDADGATAAVTKIKGLLPLVEKLYPAGVLK